jgi:hypothetical protein
MSSFTSFILHIDKEQNLLIMIKLILLTKRLKFYIFVSITVSNNFRFSNLAVFGATSIPIENPLLPRIVDENDDDNEANQSQIPINGVMYNIRDKPRGNIASWELPNS